MAAPTTKAKRGGEWERGRDEAQEEVERLQAAPRTRGNRKALVEETVVVQDLSNALEKQYRLWERSGEVAIRRAYVCAQRQEGQRDVAVVNGAPPPHTWALVVAPFTRREEGVRLHIVSGKCCVGFLVYGGESSPSCAFDKNTLQVLSTNILMARLCASFRPTRIPRTYSLSLSLSLSLGFAHRCSRRYALRKRYQLRHLPRGEEDEPRRECDSSPAGGGERCRSYYGEGEDGETLGAG